MNRTLFAVLAIVVAAAAISCADKENKADPSAASEAPEAARTPVTVTHVTISALRDSIELNATSAFLQNYYVKATTTGYIKAVYITPGEYVGAGKTLFRIETKESMVIGNAISSLDSSFKFSGTNLIKSSGHGYVIQLNHQVGDYVQDGEQLAVVSDMSSFAFLLNLPYELRPFVLNKKTVNLELPDGTNLPGRIASVMPTVDSLSQTQVVVIKVNSSALIPQNLIAKVHIIKDIKPNAQSVPKSALLSDETQSNFWVMKMIDSGTAVKVPVEKGIEFKGRVEIIRPVFSDTDEILVTGNYGMADTAKVTIAKP
ncbi:MAG TPA: efflux RND transporter periplasmic adaptor subunit [Puia sp.]|nr:efflux RND transporter periplasmic adaptor subunit [Puia sp.]